MEKLLFKNNAEVIEGITVEEALKKYEPMVHYFVNQAKTNHVCSKEDLCQEGRTSIVVAFRNFDSEQGASLTTWMYHMIKSSIIEYQKKHLSILSGGAYLQTILRKAGKDASIEEIMEFGVSKKTAMAATYVQKSYDSVDYSALEPVIGEDCFETTHLESLPWRKCLNKTEIFAIENYYGFNGERRTMKEIGKELGKSRKAVSYMINKALVKIRHLEGIADYALY